MHPAGRDRFGDGTTRARALSRYMRRPTHAFLTLAGLYLAVGLLAVTGRLVVEVGLVETLPRLRWLTIHLVTIGGLTQSLFAALPHLAGGSGGTDTGSRTPAGGRSRWAQWLLLNAGYPLVLIGMATGSTETAVAGATLVLAALGLLLVQVRRVATGRFAPFYRVAPWFLVVGIFAAFGMLLGLHGPGGYFGSIEAHVHANVWGFLALVAAPTLLRLVPRFAGADLAHPALERVTFWGIAVGATGLVAGPWLAIHALTFTGLAIYVVGTVALLANVVGTYRQADCPRDGRLGHLLGAYLWLVVPVPIAPFVLLFPDLVPAAVIERAAINGLVFGWMLQLAMAFLPAVATALLAVPDRGLVDLVARVDADFPAPRWTQVATVNFGMLALWLTPIPLPPGVEPALALTGYTLVGVAWATFLHDLWGVLTRSDTAETAHPTASGSQ